MNRAGWKPEWFRNPKSGMWHVIDPLDDQHVVCNYGFKVYRPSFEKPVTSGMEDICWSCAAIVREFRRDPYESRFWRLAR